MRGRPNPFSNGCGGRKRSGIGPGSGSGATGWARTASANPTNPISSHAPSRRYGRPRTARQASRHQTLLAGSTCPVMGQQGPDRSRGLVGRATVTTLGGRRSAIRAASCFWRALCAPRAPAGSADTCRRAWRCRACAPAPRCPCGAAPSDSPRRQSSATRWLSGLLRCHSAIRRSITATRSFAEATIRGRGSSYDVAGHEGPHRPRRQQPGLVTQAPNAEPPRRANARRWYKAPSR